MSQDVQHLLVPITVEALVIEDQADGRQLLARASIPRPDGAAGDLKWSPARADYGPVGSELRPAGPRPFFGAAERERDKTRALVLSPERDAGAVPTAADRGVYLRWTVPRRLRSARTVNQLDFPPLPDQWLVVRFHRYQGPGGEAITGQKAFFVDGGVLVLDSEPTASLLVPGLGATTSYRGCKVGKAVPLADYDRTRFPYSLQELEAVAKDPNREGELPVEAKRLALGERVAITATGTEATGSPTFCASLAENRNILSWHDDLADLRTPVKTGGPPASLAVSYLVAGWYHDPKADPLALFGGLQALGWRLEDQDDRLASSTRCLLHGMVAHINYWNPETYKGPLLGYPGAPAAHPEHNPDPVAGTPIQVALGHTPEDALLGLIAPQETAPRRAELWKALEAVIHRRADTLPRESIHRDQGPEWDDQGRQRAAHGSAFTSCRGGMVWAIVREEEKAGLAPPLPGVKLPEPMAVTPALRTELAALNALQEAADRLARRAAALQLELYPLWWQLCRATATEQQTKAARERYAPAAERLSRLLAELNQASDRLEAKRQALAKQLEELPRQPRQLGLRLVGDEGPRFYGPGDPFVVIRDLGGTRKYGPVAAAGPTICRRRDQLVTESKVGGAVFGAAVAADLQGHLPRLGDPAADLLALVGEASLIEQTVTALAHEALARHRERPNPGELWADWWNAALTRELAAEHRFTRQRREQLPVPAARLVSLWGRQPFSPLLLDWRITWNRGDATLFPVGEVEHRPPAQGATLGEKRSVSGRAPLAAIPPRLLETPIQELLELIRSARDPQPGKERLPMAEVREVLAGKDMAWGELLTKLKSADLMGQALSGLQRLFLQRDESRPRALPNPSQPWNPNSGDTAAAALFAPVRAHPSQPPFVADSLAPPRDAEGLAPGGWATLPFGLLRAGLLDLEHLWIVDEFGQWADLLVGSGAKGAQPLKVSPRGRRYANEREDDRLVLPPRLLQPARLDFRFQGAGAACAWLYYNYLDEALAVCDGGGRLLGELALIHHRDGGRSVRWSCLREPGGLEPEQIENLSLRGFVLGLRGEKVAAAGPPTRLEELVQLIETTQRRQVAPGRGSYAAGLPVALVEARLGLELFGDPWSTPHPQGPTAAAVETLRFPVRLGGGDPGDGLVGYFRRRNPGTNELDWTHLVPSARAAEKGRYVGDPATRLELAPYPTPSAEGAPPGEPIALLVDPRGAVRATSAILPAKSIQLPGEWVEAGLSCQELSFSAGPIWWRAEGGSSIPLPVQTDPVQWLFRPIGAAEAKVVATLDSGPRFDDTPRLATAGRLILRRTPPAPPAALGSPVKGNL